VAAAQFLAVDVACLGAAAFVARRATLAGGRWATSMR